jgi:hypothetical protein
LHVFKVEPGLPGLNADFVKGLDLMRVDSGKDSLLTAK